MNDVLPAAYREEEVYIALSRMHPIKAPGPNGMCPMFFQTYWHIVGRSVSGTIIDILRGAQIASKLNKILLLSSLKKSKANHMSNFRPISFVMLFISWSLKCLLIDSKLLLLIRVLLL